jgi:hypothetical protein
MNQPPRRTEPHKHLDASIGPVERSLRHRADVLDAEAHEPESEPTIGSAVKMLLAQEFRALADEFHFQW